MIKYAHRGLVEGGAISSLFEKLYILAAASCTGLFYSLSFTRKIEEKFLYKLCCTKEIENIEFNSVKTAVMTLTFGLIMTILYSFLYFSCLFLIRKRRIFVSGNYQRNVLTLYDTYMLALIAKIGSFLGLIVASFFKWSPESIRFSVISVNIFMIAMIGYVLPVFVHLKLYCKMPEFYSNYKIYERKYLQVNQAKILIPRPQLSPFSHLPYKVLRRVNYFQEEATIILYEKKLPKIIVSPPV